MIRAIAALDNKRGIATANGIPWRIPADHERFREITKHSSVIMGYNTYKKFRRALPSRRNYVWCRPGTVLRTGFETVYDLDKFLAAPQGDVWIIGGGKLYEAALAYYSELYLTQINADYDCTIFFPKFDSDFRLSTQSNLQKEGDITYTYQTWTK